MRSLSIAATGMLAQQLNVDVISNNIANLSTTGYKRSRAAFQDLLYQNITRPGTTSSNTGTIIPTGLQVGLGAKPAGIYRINEQGPLLNTKNDLDLAISGKGYFQVTLPDGDIVYTRDGAFQLNDQGILVTSQGYTVSPSITIPQGAIKVEVNKEGQVIYTLDSSPPTVTTAGQLDLVTFINESGLEALGDNFFRETDATGSPLSGFAGDDGFGTIEQGFLESSNVDSITEITSLITAQRSYELNSRVISTSDEMLQTVSQLR